MHIRARNEIMLTEDHTLHTLASMHTNSYVVVVVDLVSAKLDLKKWIGEGLNNRTRTMQTDHPYFSLEKNKNKYIKLDNPAID